ncbi:MAG: hypothetical protein ACJ798_13215 [Phenylobacterium sp.]
MQGDERGRESGRRFGFRSYADDTPRDLGPDDDLGPLPPEPRALHTPADAEPEAFDPDPRLVRDGAYEAEPPIAPPRATTPTAPADLGLMGYEGASFSAHRARPADSPRTERRRRAARWPFIVAGGLAVAAGAVAGVVLPIADLLPRPAARPPHAQTAASAPTPEAQPQQRLDLAVRGRLPATPSQPAAGFPPQAPQPPPWRRWTQAIQHPATPPPSAQLGLPAAAAPVPAAPAEARAEAPAPAVAAPPLAVPSAAPQVAVPEPAERETAAAEPCARAVSPAEQVVCREPELAAADRRMRRAYARALALGVMPASVLRADQDEWLNAREAAARVSPQAVARLYRQRIGELESAAPAAGPP